jgi:uncharacterized membrane protein YjfL (UPF0719 family)
MRIDLLVVLMVEALALVFIAKVARDRWLRRRGYFVNALVVGQRSTGAAVSQAGYLVGIQLGFLGAISYAGRSAGFVGLIGHIALFGGVAIVLQLVAEQVSDTLIFRGLAPTAGDTADTNVSHAVGKAAVSIATGLVLRGSLSDPSAGVLACLAWFVVGQVLMVAAVLLYCRLTPYDDLAEIKRNNLAAGFPIAGILLALGLVMEAAILSKAGGTVVGSALQLAKFLGVSLVLVYAFRAIAGFVLLPKVKLSSAIVDQRSVAAGLQEGVSFLLVSLIVTYFLL